MTKQLFALILAICLLLSFPLGCATETPDNPSQSAGATAQTGSDIAEETTRDHAPDIDIKNYNREFAFAKIGSGLDDDFFIPEKALNDGITDATYERAQKIKEHLGVTLVMRDAGDWEGYTKTIQTNVSTGTDNLQLALTHVYRGIPELVINNLVVDFTDLPAVDLEQSYWNKQLMDEVTIDGKYLIGYSDFCLAETHCIVFNKRLLSNNGQSLPYEQVKNHEWTLDELIARTQDVHKDLNGDGQRDIQDIYGMSGWGWVFLISFLTSSDFRIVDRDTDDNFRVAYSENSDRLSELVEKIRNWYNADGTWFWKSSPASGTVVAFKDQTSLFQLINTAGLIELKNYDLQFGVLPYPLYTVQQPAYRSLNWNGVLCVPNTVTSADMVGETLELLAYEAAPVKTAFFDRLLGNKVANTEDDQEMLEIIWNSVVTDVGLITATSSDEMDRLVYMIPTICEKKNGNFSSYLAKNVRKAQIGLDRLFGQSD